MVPIFTLASRLYMNIRVGLHYIVTKSTAAGAIHACLFRMLAKPSGNGTGLERENTYTTDSGYTSSERCREAMA